MSIRKAWKYGVKLPMKRAWLKASGREPIIQPSFLDPSDPDPRIDFEYPEDAAGEDAPQLGSGLCTLRQLTSPAFKYWLTNLGQSTSRKHRKLWELAYVTQALYERGCLAPGKRGLGFAVGEEPLPAFYADQGVDVLATDLDADDERSKVWRRSGQHMSNVSQDEPQLTHAGGRILQRSVDMNHIPRDLRGFDFTWSTCSFEHCGSIDLGLGFLEKQMECLRPGGIAVHTTEFNLTSNESTIKEGRTVLFRRSDIEGVVERLQKDGHEVEPLSFDPGDQEFDRHVDWPPYSEDLHMRLVLGRYAATSIGLIIRKADAQAASSAA